jgi:cytidylate kinase
MQKKQIITISGSLGSGKTSTADLLAEKLKFKRFSAGDFTRKMSIKKKVSLHWLGENAEKNDAVDQIIDAEVKKAGKKDRIIIDSRLAFHWAPDSFKVYLDLPMKVAKERIFNNLKENKLREKTEGEIDPKKIYQNIVSRRKSEKKRYLKYYGVDHTNKKNFDLVVNTGKNNLEQVAKIVLTKYQDWVKK